MRSSMTRRRGIRTLGGGDDLPLTMGAAAWWSARSVSQAHDSNVNDWTDLTGNGHTATPGGDWAPNYNTNAINGRPALFFTLANQERFENIAGSIPIPSTSRDYAVFVVARIASFSGPDWTFYAERNSADDSGIIAQCGGKSTSQNTHDARDDADSLVRDGATTLSLATNYVLGFAMDASSVKTGVNGVWTSGSAWTNGTTTVNTPTIGCNKTLGSAAALYSGHIGDLVIINRSLSAAEKSAMDRWLGAYYGITVA